MTFIGAQWDRLADSPWGILVAGLLVLGAIWLVSSLLRVHLLRTLLFALPAACLAVLGLFGLLFWWPVHKLTGLFLRVVPLDDLLASLLKIPAAFNRDPLMKGRREAYAKAVWPPHLYPDLYGLVPADIARPVYEDGRLLGGMPMQWLADRHVTKAVVRSAFVAGIEAGMLYFLLAFAFPLIRFVIRLIWFIPSLFASGDQPAIDQWPGDPPEYLSSWSIFTINLENQVLLLWYQLTHLILYLPAQLVIAFGVTLIAIFLLFNTWFRQKTASYRVITKDADVRWSYRAETRKLLRQTFLRQLNHATGYLKNSKTYLVGTALGILRARGDLAAPMRGQSLMLDEESLFQHVLVFGGTGEGKTTAVLKPLMRQILADGKFGAFVTDAKGVLWQDTVKTAKQIGRESDVILIGTGPEEYGVNVVAGLTPAQIAATLRSVLNQLGGSKESFWPDMAATLIRHMLTLGRAFARTDEGKKQTQAGLSPYSLWWAYQALIREDWMMDAIAHVKATYDAIVAEARKAPTNKERRAVIATSRPFQGTDLLETAGYLRTVWKVMAKETKSGIVANVTQLLDGFGGSPVLRKRFASGLDDGCLSLRSALDGKILVSTLSSIEDGLAARIVSILIKTTLYREARLREAELKREVGGLKPQDRPCLVVMDEVQELVTSDLSSGLSDATFWNVARSTGLAGLFATQTFAALDQALGKDSAQNFVQQSRSKIFFRSEDQTTIDFACWCAGEQERNRVFDDDHRESIEYRALIDNWDPLTPINDSEKIDSQPGALFAAARSLLTPEGRQVVVTSQQAAYDTDTRFIPNVPSTWAADAGQAASLSQSSYQARVQALQSATWRAEDLTRSYRSQGNAAAPTLTSSDMMQMGRWHAFAHIQRAGAVRQDLIMVTHDFS